MPVFQLSETPIFPDPGYAEDSGLLAVGGDLSPGRLITAYSKGIFPWYSKDEPILWWFTNPRLVLFPWKLKVSKRLARYYRQPLFKITINSAFSRVIENCASIARKDQDDTWITEEMKAAYLTLHHLGYAHSVECWKNGELAGGLYGVALGKVFFGESMFSRENNGSKIALVALVNHLQTKNYKLIDCQMTTDHLLRMGAEEISGKTFTQLLEKHVQTSEPDPNWSAGWNQTKHSQQSSETTSAAIIS